jgi:selenophosphate synthetase-related protein
MDLDFLAWEIKNYEGLTRKRYIGQVIRAFRGEGRLGARTMASFGEDAAVIDTGGRGVSLLATDGIWGRLIKADPWWAGYCAVLVNVNDIASMGGRPVGMVDVLSLSSVRFCRDVSRGLAHGME